ncbi:MAG: FxsA family protein [Acidimicrobiia bacterium]|nr:FxsA family protein [Acidimicrobiia bacterium]
MRVLALFAAVALGELATFLAVESRIGLPTTLLIALATAVIGSMLVRRAGGRVWTELREKLTAGQAPTRQITHGAAILVAGALLISPGFLTDTIGFVLLIPAVRDFIHERAKTRFQSRVEVRTYPPASDVIDVEGWEVTEPEEEPRRLR